MPKETPLDDLAQAGAQPSVTFRDKAFRSRMFVFTDGGAAPVEKSLITVSTRERVAQLEAHADFERTSSGA